MEDNHRLLSTISELTKELKIAKANLESMTKSVRIMHSSTDDLNKNISFRKQASAKSGVGFSQSKSNVVKGESPLSQFFVPAKHTQIPTQVYVERTV